MWTDFQNSFHQLIRTNILYVYTAKISTSPAIMLLHYLVEVENPKKMLLFDSILNKLFTCS